VSAGKIVFTNGCFDLFHVGHSYSLLYCRTLAGPEGTVIVGVNSDSSVKRLKGETRPIIPQYQRVQMLQGSRYVDRVIVFNDDTPYDIIKRFKPDIIVKGSDYAGKESEVVGYDLAEVKILPDSYSVDISTSKLIEKIKAL